VITVRCNYRTPIKTIDAFINERRAWIEKHVNKNAAAQNTFADIKDYSNILVYGQRYTLICGQDKDVVSDGAIAIKSLKSLKNIYIKNFSDSFLKLFNIYCKRYNFNVNSVGFKDYKSRWGCCDGKNNICFNYKLLMLPSNLQIYVIVHELCHTRQHNHSQYFWAEVKNIIPDLKSIRIQMKEYSFITRLY
jgi:hypothetical protein